VCDIHLDTPKIDLPFAFETNKGRLSGFLCPNAVLFIIALRGLFQQALFYMFFAFLIHFCLFRPSLIRFFSRILH